MIYSTIPKYISHIRKNINGEIEAYQDNEEHCKNVATIAKQFANKFGMGEIGYIMGLLHDKGKERVEFQEFIRYINNIPGHKYFSPHERQHAYIGGLIANRASSLIYPLIGNPIMGHHRGLYDYVDQEDISKLGVPKEINYTDPENIKFNPLAWFSAKNPKKEDFHHIVRMLFSCLVDADYLDTEHFMQPKQYERRGNKSTINQLLHKLNDFLSRFGEPTTDVNRIRQYIQNICLKESQGKPGFYSLTVPTGGGKTLSSLVWAINHAMKNNKQRIIIAIPYTSIIVQTAAILRNIFGTENVLEHHSNIKIEEIGNEEMQNKAKLATENWDYPIIVTTNVQLFESLFASHPSTCRKLHNICNSVLILDEVQTLPVNFLQPIIDSLDTYKRLFGISVLFTTASQPILNGIHQGTNPTNIFNGLENIKEIVSTEINLHDKLRRVELVIEQTPYTYDEITEQIIKHNRVICIVNTRRDAKELYDRLPNEGIRIHLSRMMCPAHLTEEIDKMKTAIANSENTIIRVISTQLIEAGVDIDFPVVFRQEAGLDSLLQAAGRCNREGKLDICKTYVFSLSKEHALPPGHLSLCNSARKNMNGEYDWFSPEAINDYFLQLYSRIESFDSKNIRGLLYCTEQMFETAANEFKLIDDSTKPIIINWKESIELIESLKKEGPLYNIVKELGKYSVNLRKKDFDQMLKEHCIEEIIEGFYVAPNKSQYNNNVGLLTENQWLEENWII